MNEIYVTFRSVTFAQRGESVLRRGGIEAGIQRTPRWMEERGCGYCLRLRGTKGARALRLLREAGVPYRKVYGKTDTGEWEALNL